MKEIFEGTRYEDVSSSASRMLDRLEARRRDKSMLDQILITLNIMYTRRKFCFCKQRECSECAEYAMIGDLLNKMDKHEWEQP